VAALGGAMGAVRRWVAMGGRHWVLIQGEGGSCVERHLGTDDSVAAMAKRSSRAGGQRYEGNSGVRDVVVRLNPHRFAG
jgi:hypothetical protein